MSSPQNNFCSPFQGLIDPLKVSIIQRLCFSTCPELCFVHSIPSFHSPFDEGDMFIEEEDILRGNNGVRCLIKKIEIRLPGLAVKTRITTVSPALIVVLFFV